MPSRRVTAVFVVLLFAAALAAGPFRPVTSRLAHAIGLRHTPPAAAPGAPLPAIALTNLDGTPAQVASTGTVVYNVFTSWCPSCNAELPDLLRVQQALRKDGVRFVGIDQGESAGRVAAFIAARGIRYPVVLDPSSASTTLLGARMIPETLIVRDGIVARIIVGPTTAAALRDAVKNV